MARVSQEESAQPLEELEEPVPTVSEIAEVIGVLRERAKRYSLNDRRRLDIDAEVDDLVNDWLAAPH